MGYVQLNSIQLLASDVNGSGSVTLADYTYMMINYLTQGNQFPIGPWVFETKPFTAGTGSRTGTGVSSSGSSSGDANGTFVPTKNGTQISTFSSYENVSFESKKNIPLPIKVSNATRIGGMHLAFRVPDGLVISNVTSPLDKIYYSTEGNILRVTWFDCNNTEMDQSVDGTEIDIYKPILNVEAEVAGPVAKGKVYTLELLGESHFINTDGEVINGMQLVTPALTIVEAPQATVNTYPNPFFGQATFSIDAPYAGSLKISLYDNTGRLVREVENQYIESGQHQATLNGQDLTPGIYFYNISLEGQETFTQTGSIIKSR